VNTEAEDPLADIGLTANDMNRILKQGSLEEQRSAMAKIIQAKTKGRHNNLTTPSASPQIPDRTPSTQENQMEIEEMSQQSNPPNV
jgi:hypothetical protein